MFNSIIYNDLNNFDEKLPRKNKILCLTGHLFALSFVFYLINSNKTFHENVLGGFLVATYISSQLFWYDAIRNSLLHKIDSIIAKTSMMYFMVYTYLQKQMTMLTIVHYTLVVFAVCYTAHLSDKESSKKWCSDKHILYHSFMHFSCFIGSLYAFI